MNKSLFVVWTMLIWLFLMNFLFGFFFNLLIESSVSLIIKINLKAAFRFLFDIKINFQIPSFKSPQLFPIHFLQCWFCRMMLFKYHIGESFRLASLPVFANSYFLYFPKRSKSISNIVFFKLVRQILYEKSFTIFRHWLGYFESIWSRSCLFPSCWLYVDVSAAHLFSRYAQSTVVAFSCIEWNMGESSAFPTILKSW